MDWVKQEVPRSLDSEGLRSENQDLLKNERLEMHLESEAL